QALQAVAYGAEGIGLCRTEHMFFDHITEFREMILARNADEAILKARADAKISTVFINGKYDVKGEVTRGEGDKAKKRVEPLITGREKALVKMLKFQRQDFEGLFKAMKGFPVTIRTLDPPLHEFLPHDDKGQAEVAKALGIKPEVVAERVNQLHE